MPAKTYPTIQVAPKHENLFAQIRKLQMSSTNMRKTSMDWFQSVANRLSRVTPNKIMADPYGRFKGIPIPGSMYFFFYSAKHAKTLPIWDKFPMVIPLSISQDSFIGLNLHYLDPQSRMALLYQLYEFLTDVKFNTKTRFQMTYQLLKHTPRVAAFKPCIHMYLFSHLRSTFLEIPAKEWGLAASLPVARWQKTKPDWGNT